jgi:enolase
VGHVKGELNEALAGRAFDHQTGLDRAMLELDGTPDKARLGANAILAVSLAFARACAAGQNVPLYQYFAGLLAQPLQTLPRPTINLFSGGKHAGGQAPIQDVLVVPAAARTMDEALAMTFAVYQAAAELIYRKYGMRALSADEGGLAPAFPSAEAMLADAVESIHAAGLEPGREMALAIDVASSHFYRQDHYYLGAEPLDSRGLIRQLLDWLDRYPIVSIEDGLAEEDWAHWPELRAALADRSLVLGDDLLCTNPQRIRRAVETQAADALLLKVNQIGTLTEAAEANQLARSAGWRVTVSARSGETEDNWLADLAVGWAGDQIKVGSITQSERLAKYNRLLAIEAETGLPLVNWP